MTIGLIALVTSLLVTSRNRREKVRQLKTKERIATISTRQLLRAFQHAAHPIASDSIWRRQSPACDLDEADRMALEAAALMAQPLSYAGFESVFSEDITLEMNN